jgi:hypothetical protein
MSKGITAKERTDLLGADEFARLLRRPLNTTLDFHPCHMDEFPTGRLDEFFAELRVRISTWLKRKGIYTYWVWTRENYEGARREHLHIVLHLPPHLRAELEAHIRGLPRYKGNAFVVEVGERKNEFNPVTRRWEDGLRYRMKQLRGDAVGAPGPTRLNRETKSRRDGAPVAPVYGQRCGVSDSLSLTLAHFDALGRHAHASSLSSVQSQGTGRSIMAAKVSGSRIPGRHTQLEDGLGGLDLASNCTRPSWKARTRRT